MKYSDKGFTLIELMIVVAIIAIIATIAMPAYSDYVTRARRADAKDALLMIQLAEEKWRANNSAYGSLTDLGLSDPFTSANNHYSVTITTVSTPPSTYVATAMPTGVQATADTLCPSFIVTHTGISAVQSYIDSCWNR